MWKRSIGIMFIIIFIGIHHTAAQNNQASTLVERGVLSTPLRYIHRLNKPVETNSALCVINTSNEGPQWFLLNADYGSSNIRIGSISTVLMLIADINASPDGKFLAVISVGEGHPILEVVNLPLLLQEKQYNVLYEIDPYPGVIEIRTWEGGWLHVGSDVLLTHRDRSTGRVPAELTLSGPEIFGLNVLTGEIIGVSEGAKNPVKHYTNVLLDLNADDAEKDAALSRILAMSSEDLTVMQLLEILEQETDPQRINKLLDQINKLRK